ncbi:MAG: LytTR family DNA-binding domain-containing protein [Clostridiales bacterium]|jgi:DNA-binding LytR/AlgR family response regulator|nr:LytTR family DNA-binding domain-containing protein [Clostridiales bacterium]
MVIRIAIVEDDEKTAETLERYIGRYAAESGTAVAATRFSDGMHIVTDYRPVYDIILMDIQMKLLSGMDAAKRIREMDKGVTLIFITNMAQYAVKGYAVGALDFLLKPVSYFALSQQLKRSVERLGRGKDDFLLLPVDDGMVKLDLARIIFIEVFRHTVTVHAKDGEYGLSRPMKEVERELAGKNFFRCNNCYLVNLAHVRSINGHTTDVGGHSLAVSRPRRKAFAAAFADYVGRGFATSR